MVQKGKGKTIRIDQDIYEELMSRVARAIVRRKKPVSVNRYLRELLGIEVHDD